MKSLQHPSLAEIPCKSLNFDSNLNFGSKLNSNETKNQKKINNMKINSKNSETSYWYYIGRIDAKDIYLAAKVEKKVA